MNEQLTKFNNQYKEIKNKEKELIQKMRILMKECEKFEKDVEDLYQLSQKTMYYHDKKGYLQCIGGNKTCDKIDTLESLRSHYSIKMWDTIHKC